VSDKQLARMLEQEDTTALEKLGGPEGVAKALKVDPKKGIPDDDSDIKSRQQIFGSNTYPEKPTKGFLLFVWEALQDVTLIVLMVCACISLAVGIVTEGIESGWYDGAGILLSITLVVLVTSITDYQQSLQFQNLNKEKAKIYINVRLHSISGESLLTWSRLAGMFNGMTLST
jgi:Ca2+-transporting ATPase